LPFFLVGQTAHLHSGGFVNGRLLCEVFAFISITVRSSKKDRGVVPLKQSEDGEKSEIRRQTGNRHALWLKRYGNSHSSTSCY
jgi:hypothetical protein